MSDSSDDPAASKRETPEYQAVLGRCRGDRHTWPMNLRQGRSRSLAGARKEAGPRETAKRRVEQEHATPTREERKHGAGVGNQAI